MCWGWRNESRTLPPCTCYLVRDAFPVAQELEGLKMLKAPAPTKTQSAFRTDTNDLNYPTGQRISKAESTLLARLALAGHVVHKGRCDDYTVCKYGYAQYCQDLEALDAFAYQLGVK